MREKALKQSDSTAVLASPLTVHPLREYRKTPVNKLIKKLGLYELDKPAPYRDLSHKTQKVRIMLKQHAGVPAEACVKVGQRVKKGDMVGLVDKEKLGCPVHASINGRVAEVNSRYVVIEAENA